MTIVAQTFSLNRDGFTVIPGALNSQHVDKLLGAIAAAEDFPSSRRSGQLYALRNLLNLSQVDELARSATIRKMIEPVLGAEARVVRGIFFDKTPAANWKVAWHQDLSIAVRKRVDVAGFGPWSIKAGVHHVQPPVQVLQQMLTVRVHLDDCGLDNGPVRVIPGSHSQGVLAPSRVQRLVVDGAVIAVEVPRGGALLMRPLLLHASSPATRATHRRVIHLEFASSDLAAPLEWHAR